MWEQIAANRRKSIVLVISSALLLVVLGWFLGEYFGGQGTGPFGVVAALLVWLVMTLVAWFKGDSIYLAMSGAKQVQKKDLPILFNVVEEMTLAAGLTQMPGVYVIDDPVPNAFACGRKPETAAVAVTSGLLKRLSRDELQGVVAHEIAHVKNRDIQLMLFAGVLAGAIVILAEFGLRGMFFGGGRRSRRDSSDSGGAQGIIMIVAVVLMILAPIIAHMIYFAISRKREYLADASAATFTRYPEGLASALEKISRAPGKLRGATSATAPMYIINPLKFDGKMAANATSTHPPIDERIKILRSMGNCGLAEYEKSYQQVSGKKGGVIPGSALSEETLEMATPRAASGSNIEIARQVDDFFYRSSGYERIECSCGATLKIPPNFGSRNVTCPKCKTEHKISA